MIPVVLRGAVRTQACTPQLVRYYASRLPPKATSSRQPHPPTASAIISSLPSLDFNPTERLEHPERAERTKDSKDSLSSIERRKRYLARVSLGIFAVALGVQAFYLGQDRGADELESKKIKIEDAPSESELLPPPHKFERPYTLLVSMDDLLVTSTWDQRNGWRTAKRPGVDYFLAYLSQFYAIAIFTSQHNYIAIPIIEKLDPYYFFFAHRLFREATRSVNGKIVKDLSHLNRDLSKVILLDAHEEHTLTHPENSIVLPKWTGTPDDKGLLAMIPFLESIAIYKAPDVRPILQAYHGKDIPVEYAKREAEARERHIAEWKSKPKGLTYSGFTISSLFGTKTKPFESHSPIPPTYLERMRAEAQRQYKADLDYLDTNRDEFDRILEEERQAVAKEMSESQLGLDDPAGKKPQDEEAAAVR